MASLIKRWLFVLSLAVFFPVRVHAGDIVVSKFGGGLNTQDSPATIDPSQAQDLLNVNFTPGGTAVFKRDGYALFQTLPAFSTSPVHGGYHFQQVGGNDVQLWGSDVNLYASVSDATFVKIATGTVGATWQCADSQGSAYCLTSSRDTCVKTDGSSANTTFQGSVPLGTMVSFTPTQMVVAGVNGNESTLYISQQNAFTNFTIGILPSSSFTEPIASPGSRITHIAYYFGKLFWWKDQSFGYMTFTGQNDVQINIVSNQIGTLDNSDAFWNSSGFDSGAKFTGTAQANAYETPGGIYFRGQDNHIYVYDGYYLTRLSRSISPTVTAANRRKSNAWTQQTQADFNAGSYSTTTFSSALNGVTISTDNANFTDSSFENNSSWNGPYVAPWNVGSGVFTQSCGGGFVNPKDGSFMANYAKDTSVSFTAAVNITDAQTGANYGSVTLPYSTNNCGVNGWTKYTLTSTATLKTSVQIQIIVGTSAISSPAFAFSGSTITFWSGSDISGLNFRKQMWFDLYEGGATDRTKGVYYSAVDNAPNLVTWGNFGTTTSGTGGTHAFFVRSSTNAFTVLSSTPTWISQAANSIVAASTGTFMQFSDTFTVVAASETPTLNSFTFNWNEGTASDKAYISYFNDAVWFSVSSSTSALTNNRIFYWDILNGGWSLYNIPADGMLIENNTLYFGDPTQGRIFKFGGVPTDNSASINSYWRSKSFLGADPFVQNEFNQADFILGESSTSLAYTYTLDSKTSTTFLMSPYDSAASLIQRNFLLPAGKIGKYYDFKIGDNSSNASWRMIAHRAHYNALNWNPVIR